MSEPRSKAEDTSCTDPAEVLAALHKAEELRQARESLDDLLIEGLDSGDAQRVDAQYWQDKLDALKARASAAKPSNG